MQEKNIVVIGAGPGTDIVLSGLKRHTSRITALVSTFDAAARSRQYNGTGSGNPSDEVRSSLLALGTDPTTTLLMEQLFSYRFSNSVDMSGYTFGNLFLSALTDITGATDLALQAAARVLNVQGQVLPITLHTAPLIAELADGTEVEVSTPAELAAASSQAELLGVRLAQPMPALSAALQAISNADIIVFGPADFYFGLIAPLQLEGMREALRTSDAVKVFVCNTLTQPHITSGWPASRFIRTVSSYISGASGLDCVIVNSAPFTDDMLGKAVAEGREPVRFDLDECLALGPNVIVRPVAGAGSMLHDPEKLARTILFLGGGRSARKPDKKGFFDTSPLNDVPLSHLATRLAES